MTSKRLHASYRVGGRTHEAELALDGESLAGTADGSVVSARVSLASSDEIVLRLGGRRVLAAVARRGSTLLVSVEGTTYEVERAHDGETAAGALSAEPFATSPMAGLLTKVHVAVGAAVKKGAPLFAVEAMKMEYVVAADRDTVVIAVRRNAGDRVTLGEVIVAFASSP